MILIKNVSSFNLIYKLSAVSCSLNGNGFCFGSPVTSCFSVSVFYCGGKVGFDGHNAFLTVFFF